MCDAGLCAHDWRKETLTMMTKRRRRHASEEVVRKLRNADAMPNAGEDQAAMLQMLEVSEATYLRSRKQYGGMKAEEARRLMKLEGRFSLPPHW